MDIKSLYMDELVETMKNMGQPAFRAKQIYNWLHAKLVESYDEMLNLPKDLRNNLKEHYPLKTLEVVDKLVSQRTVQVSICFP